MKKVVVATTFRDFSGSANDSIQWLFLWALRRISSVEIQLVVTTFGEEGVIPAVRNVFPDAIFFQEARIPGHRYSHTAVLANGMRTVRESDASALLWTTCDVIIPGAFIDAIAEEHLVPTAHTSHPHIELTAKGSMKEYPLASGFDSIAMSRTLALDEGVRRLVEQYRFYDWGMFESFLIAMVKLTGARMLNHARELRIIKLENDRRQTQETVDWLTASWRQNAESFERFLADRSLPRSYFNLYYCHKQFSGSPRSLLSWESACGELEALIRRFQTPRPLSTR